MRNLLLCSVGRRAELVKIFTNEMREKGRIISIDNQDTAPALYFADKWYTAPRITDESYLSYIIEICEKEKISGITTLIDPEIGFLAKNKEILKDKGVIAFVPSQKVSDICFDKYLMYKFLIDNHFPCAVTYCELQDFIDGFKNKIIDFPVFIKPRNGSGSVGIKKVNTLEELQFYIGNNDEYIIQEFLEGIEYDADVYVDIISNELVSAFTKRKISTRIGGADKTISYKDKKLFELIEEFVKCLGLTGPADIDLFNINGEYYISEVNPRFGGAYLHAHACGLNFPVLMYNNICGITNEKSIGNYDEDILMMMFDSIITKKVAI